MKNSDSQIILYAKGWFERTDTIKDMQILIGARCNMNKVSVSNIYNVLSGIAYPHIDGKYGFDNFIDTCFRFGGTDAFDSYNSIQYYSTISIENMIDAFLSVLSIVRVLDNDNKILIELDEPDYNLLPRREND